jgi:hypothetical protein
MTYKERTIAVTLVCYSLVLVFFLIRLFQIVLAGGFDSPNVFRLWGTTIALAIIVTILATILTNIGSRIIHAVKTKEKPSNEDLQDERDRSIDLRGTKVSYFTSLTGIPLSMLTYALGQPPLVMFTMLIFFGIAAQILGDITRLYLYRRGI